MSNKIIKLVTNYSKLIIIIIFLNNYITNFIFLNVSEPTIFKGIDLNVLLKRQ